MTSSLSGQVPQQIHFLLQRMLFNQKKYQEIDLLYKN